MIEYLYDCIRATAGQDITVAAVITDDNGEALTSGCGLMLHDDENMIVRVNGVFDGEQWNFTIPADATANRVGRYWYCICRGEESLCFKEPIYLV
jgi:hypothetical protein